MPNRKRGETDPAQCVWHSNTSPSSANHTGPLVNSVSSIDGIIEFQTNHFGGQLRGNLIVAKYKDPLFRVILNAAGTAVLPQSDPPVELVGDNTLDVVQAPDGSLLVTQYLAGSVEYYRPQEAYTNRMLVHGVFPRRGPVAGGSNLSVYGVNLNKSANPTVTVGGDDCPVVSVGATKIVCRLPPGTGTVNVKVTTTTETSVFQRGYRYITGLPV